MLKKKMLLVQALATHTKKIELELELLEFLELNRFHL